MKYQSLARLTVELGSSILARRMTTAVKLAKRGAAKFLSQTSKDALLEKMAFGQGDEQEQLVRILVAEGADPQSLVTNINAVRIPANIATAAFSGNPDKTIRIADTYGHGLLWGAVKRIVLGEIDKADFYASCKLAEDFLEHSDASVLTGNGLGREGPPIARMVLYVFDGDFTDKKLAQRFDVLRKKIMDRALVEAAQFDIEDDSLGVPGGSMNVLHLASVCGIQDVADILLERASGLGRRKLRALLSQGAVVFDSPYSHSPKSSRYTPISLAEKDGRFAVVFGFARLVGFDAKIGGKSILDTLVGVIRCGDENEFAGLLDALFEAGLDPEVTLTNGTLFHTALKQRTSDLLFPNKSKTEQFHTRIDEAFTKAAGVRRKPKSKDTPPKRPVTRSDVL